MPLRPKDIEKIRQKVKTGEFRVTGVLDAAVTSEIILFSDVYEKLTFQGTSTLTGTVEFSLDGVNFKNSTAIGASNALVTFSTHSFRAVKVSRATNSGNVLLAAK